MAFQEIRTSTPVSVVVIVISLLLAGFLLLFGVANLIHPEVREADLTQNTIVCLAVSGLGVVALLVALAAFRGISRQRGNLGGEKHT